MVLALIDRQIKQEQAYFKDLLHRAQFLCSDSLQQMILFTNLLAESIASQPNVERGCLLATFAREQQHLEIDIKQLLAEGMGQLRDVCLSQLESVAVMYPPCLNVSMREVSDMLITLLEGGIILSRLHDESYALSQQIIHYRNYLRLLFEPVT